MLHNGSLHGRRNLTSVRNVCEAAPICLFWVPNGHNELPEGHLNFLSSSLADNLTVAILTGQSWCILKYISAQVGAKNKDFSAVLQMDSEPGFSFVCSGG